MPTYVYKNLENGEIYEFKQSMRDAPFTHHPETGVPVKRVLSAPGIAFRGSGFYVNDSRKGGKEGGGEAPAASGSKDKAAGSASPPAGGSSGGKGGE